jgi:type II secretory pathway pseudopilin PulG
MQRTHLSGFTLLEAIIALALWLILSAGVFLVWQHSAMAGAGMLERQSAFENARITMDALIMNFQMSRSIEIWTNADTLQSMALEQRNPNGEWHDYRFRFNPSTGRLDIGQPLPRPVWNEFSSDLAGIQIVYIPGSRLLITVETNCAEPITLSGSVCVRDKYVNVTR